MVVHDSDELPKSKRSRLETLTSTDNKTEKTNDEPTTTSTSPPIPTTQAADTTASATNTNTNPAAVLTILSPNLLHNADQLATTYQTATPYPHGVLENIFIDGFLDQVLSEVKNNLKAKFKESDLFRVYQSIDLANIDPLEPTLHKSMPALLQLRETLYSGEYRSFVERVAGLDAGTLTEEVDSAVNCHDQGCHLLCHDDVIGTRKVSYILYLTDPTPTWTDEDGGRLELYDTVTELDPTRLDHDSNQLPVSLTSTKRVPEPFPVKTVLPQFNSMAYFVVQPGISFHSVQEVFCDRPRLSIQGWYHAKETPTLMDHASLNQLKTYHHGTEAEQSYTPITPTITTNCHHDNLSKNDIQFLSEYINPTYLTPKSITDIQEWFEEESSVQLRHFFNEKWASKIQACVLDVDSKDNVGRGKSAIDYTVGVSDDWKPVGPAHKQRFLEYVGDAASEEISETTMAADSSTTTTTTTTTPATQSGELLLHLKKTIFESPIFGRLIENFTSLGIPIGCRGKIRRFRPGLDYTIAHYGILTKESVLDATVCFVAGSGNQSQGIDAEDNDDIMWQSDDKGGFECYISADEDGGEGEAADEYDEEDDTKLLSVSASNNTLSLVYRDPGTMRFVKYVSCGAPSSRWDVSMEYELEDDDDDDNEDDDNENDDDNDNHSSESKTI